MSHLARSCWTCVVCLLLLSMAIACGSKTDSQSKEKADAATAAEIDARLKQQPPPPKSALEGLMATKDHQGSLAEAMVGRSTTPLFSSPQIQARNAPSDKPSDRSARTGASDTGIAALLPSVKEEVPQVWIGWYKNQAVDALRAAIDVNKPLVLVLGADMCVYCENFVRNTLRCPAVERWAGEAVFAYSDVAADLGGSAIGGSLNVDAYPTITVLEPEARMLLERGRINGFFDGGKLGQHFGTILRDTPARVFPRGTANDSVLPSQPNTTPQPTTAAAVAGAARLKLAHAAPAPACR